MHLQWRLSIIVGLLVSLILAAPALAQEGESSCADAAGGEPAIQMLQEGRSDFIVTGCNFKSGEDVTVGSRLKQGDGDWMRLDSIQARADSDGAFEARITVPTGELDFANGYQVEATATGAGGSSASSGMAGIAGGGTPPQNLPETGGGGASSDETMRYVLATAAVLVLAVGGVWARRLIAR
ncbi:MAG: hypothetical protein WKH64_13165 [Chloroflexia bacterium]